MKSTKDKSTRHCPWMKALALTVVMMSCAINSANAWAEILVPSAYRALAAGDKFEGVRQFAVVFETRPPRRLRSKHLELAIGQISSESSNRAFVSFAVSLRAQHTSNGGLSDTNPGIDMVGINFAFNFSDL